MRWDESVRAGVNAWPGKAAGAAYAVATGEAVTPREKVLRQQGYNKGRSVGLWDAVEIAQEHETKHAGRISELIRAEALHSDKVAKTDLAAADAIPDAPVGDEICDGCGVRYGYHGGPDGNFTDERSCREFLPPSKDTKPIPSRAELIELMRKAWTGDSQHHTNVTQMARVLDALIKVGSVRT